MFRIDPLKGVLAALALAALAALAVGLAHGVRVFERMRTDARAYGDCQIVAGLKRGAPATPPRCAPQIAAALADSARAKACEDGLARGEAGAFAAQQACGAQVKAVVAARDAARADLAQRDRLVGELKAERKADLARAEARGLSQARRNEDAQAALAAAPRDDRGHVRCDALCLSVLAGDVP